MKEVLQAKALKIKEETKKKKKKKHVDLLEGDRSLSSIGR